MIISKFSLKLLIERQLLAKKTVQILGIDLGTHCTGMAGSDAKRVYVKSD